nr:CBS domain-containing protein [Candidatus Omnitrophota bacterium]
AEWRDSPVSRIMSSHVMTISPRTPIYEIVEKVGVFNIHTFPVMQGDKLVGVIGRHDVLNATFMYV